MKRKWKNPKPDLLFELKKFFKKSGVQFLGEFDSTNLITSSSTSLSTSPSLSSLFIRRAKLQIFVWAVLMNRIEIAELFWKIGKHQIFNALLAVKLFNSLAKWLPEFEDVLNNSSK